MTRIGIHAFDGIGTSTIPDWARFRDVVTELTFRDYTPLALMNADPAGVNVKTDSPHQSVRAILDFARANPGRLKASGTVVLMQGTGASGGSAPRHQRSRSTPAALYRGSFRPPCLASRSNPAAA